MNDRAAICELHFVPSDYLPAKENSNARKRLKKDAVPSVNLVGKATKPSHCLFKIEDRPRQICALCHKNTAFRCEANICKIALCVSPCFSSYHKKIVNSENEKGHENLMKKSKSTFVETQPIELEVQGQSFTIGPEDFDNESDTKNEENIDIVQFELDPFEMKQRKSSSIPRNPPKM